MKENENDFLPIENICHWCCLLLFFFGWSFIVHNGTHLLVSNHVCSRILLDSNQFMLNGNRLLIVSTLLPSTIMTKMYGSSIYIYVSIDWTCLLCSFLSIDKICGDHFVPIFNSPLHSFLPLFFVEKFFTIVRNGSLPISKHGMVNWSTEYDHIVEHFLFGLATIHVCPSIDHLVCNFW